ncbi:hypothetical protein BGW37DRAFT_154312 [Umbelopsis sp. PMI_123]|nr:hypothetical protein BGW37DRAFT_154312 [Umbelopsis sp. PMI_123]
MYVPPPYAQTMSLKITFFVLLFIYHNSRWSVCTKFVEYDLLSLLTDVFNLPWGIWFDFMDIDHLLQDGHLPDPEFLIAMYRISDIYSRAFPFMASIAVSNDSDDEEIRMIFPPCTNHPELDRLKRYFPTDLHGLLEQPSVTFLQLNQRIEQCLFTRLAAYQEVRNQIWLVLMLSGSLLRNIASQVMKTDSCQETLTAIHLLSWLCCPTDDERLDQTERAIVSWLVTVERDKADLPLMAERFRYAKDNVFNGNLNCWYHCLFWILLPHKLEDVYNCILCIVTDDLPLIQLAIWHLVSNHCPLPDPISSVVAKRLKLRTATTL